MTADTAPLLPSPPVQNMQLPQLDGVFVLNKPAGPSSAQCVARIKRLGQKKIGHAGTLDPMAEGVLLILLGQGTKLSPYLLADGLKIYSGLLRLGVETDTWDAEGDIIAERDWSGVSPEEAARAIEEWAQLKIQDVPPYSAAKHMGKPLYKLARSGQELPQKTKEIKIFQAEALDITPPWIRFRVVCGSGVYIRSLAHSLGMRLGCGAALFQLTREHSHPFNLDQACALSDVLDSPQLLAENLRSMAEALPDWPKIRLSPAEELKIRNGNPIAAAPAHEDGRKAILYGNGIPLALACVEVTARGKFWTILRGLWN